MGKQQSRPPEESLPPSIIPDVVPIRLAHPRGGSKPDRDAVSHCIRIWASVYGLHDETPSAAETTHPARALLRAGVLKRAPATDARPSP